MNREKKKKILLVTFSDNADHQDITFGMYEQLYSEGRVSLMCTKEPRVSLRAADHVKRVDCPKRPGVCRKTFDIKTLRECIVWIKRQNFDVIFFESLHVWNLPIMLSVRGRTKIFQMIHDLIPHEGDRQAKMVDRMNRAVCRLADVIVLCNQKYRIEVTKRYGVPQERVACIDMWRRFPGYSEPNDTKRALFFGRMNPYKGADWLLEIVRRCPAVQFDVIGRVDEQMEEIAAELSKEPNVKMNNGYVTDGEMEKAFRNCKWVILPYRSATQSGVVIDAYRYSRPVVAFDVGAVREQIDDGKSGFLVTSGDIRAFSERLLWCMEMPAEKYENMCRAAYRFGEEKYAAKGAVRRFLELINQ